MKWKNLSAVLLATTFIVSACGNTSDPAKKPAATDSKVEKTDDKKQPITLNFFSNNPDRATGQGLAEQKLIDQYMKENPHVTIKVETLAPDAQYQDKIKVYNASNELPDIMMLWGTPNYMGPLVKNGSLAEFSADDFKDMGFMNGSFSGFTYNDKIYGIPKNSDFWVLYYNKKIFTDNGLTPPTNETELNKAITVLRGKKITPIAHDGRDAWTTALWIDGVAERYSGTFENTAKLNIKDPSWIKAAKHMQDSINAGIFGSGFLNQDYGTARNLFGQGKAAMFMMGQWEMGMVSDTNFPEEVRNNIGAIAFPTLNGGTGKVTDLTAWNGGGYGVSAKSKNKEAAKEFLKWFFKPTNWAKTVWENGITFPAQKYDQFFTGKETSLQKDLTSIFNGATAISGIPISDRLTPDTQKQYYDALLQLLFNKLTPEQFVEQAGKLIDKAKSTQ
ncbi:ABC transporter substrate-binding protein [Paenibacillus alba]|uniref:Extracellular solute-binding protein n=1 Tax=Paenibacillus alba TaxID=1197127 RepID=A0ABU6GD52_9BACL|nr:extracellular solute-binding protein [Paenibacillus alba]MEC0232129.1 extracellular solute-binding protein [Paenibacillus alba]